MDFDLPGPAKRLLDPVARAAEIVDIMGGYDCRRQPCWNGEVCLGPSMNARCVQHSYRRIGHRPYDPNPDQQDPKKTQSVPQWASGQHWIREKNRGRLELLLVTALHLETPAETDPAARAMIQEIADFVLRQWKCRGLATSMAEVRALADEMTRRDWLEHFPINLRKQIRGQRDKGDNQNS